MSIATQWRGSRFYQSVMDTDHLKKKQSYRTLPETNTIFICTFDPFEEGLPQYTFRNRCDEAMALTLQDGTVKYFFNCTSTVESIPDNIKALYRYIMTGVAMDELTEKLQKAVEIGRRNEKWRSEYMKELLYEMDIREEGRVEGREEERVNTEREKARADSLEKKVRELEAIIKKMGQNF